MPHPRRILAAGLAATLSLLSGCVEPPLDPGPDELPAALRAPAPGIQRGDLLARSGCNQPSCGTNAPIVTGFHLDALHPDGYRNQLGIRQVVGTLQARTAEVACAGVRSLAVVNGRLTGQLVDPNGATSACHGTALIGATLWIEGPRAALLELDAAAQALPGTTLLRQELRILTQGKVDELAPDDPMLSSWPPAAPPQTLPTYVIERTGAVLTTDDPHAPSPTWRKISPRSDGAPGEPSRKLCAPASVWIPRWTADGAPVPPAPGVPSVDQQMVIVAGEVYGAQADVLRTGDAGRGWFHLACAGSALATSRLLRHDPQAPWPTAGQRHAALKMLSASYCPRSAASPGAPLVARSFPTAGRPLPPGAGPLEARWSAAGAVCLSHARSWRQHAPAPVGDDGCCADEESYLRAIRAACPDLPVCSDATSTEGVYWTSHTFDHVAHP